MPEYYWEIVEHDGTVTPIPPSAHDTVQRRWDDGDAIHTTTHSIPANQIKKFRMTGKVFSDQPLLEIASQAFDEPLINEDGSIQSKWVKKTLPQQQALKLLATPAYRSLNTEGGMITVAFQLPTHEIHPDKVELCTDSEIGLLTRY